MDIATLVVVGLVIITALTFDFTPAVDGRIFRAVTVNGRSA